MRAPALRQPCCACLSHSQTALIGDALLSMIIRPAHVLSQELQTKAGSATARWLYASYANYTCMHLTPHRANHGQRTGLLARKSATQHYIPLLGMADAKAFAVSCHLVVACAHRTW